MSLRSARTPGHHTLAAVIVPVHSPCKRCATAAKQTRRLPIDEEKMSLWQKDNAPKSIRHADILNIGHRKRATQMLQTAGTDYATMHVLPSI